MKSLTFIDLFCGCGGFSLGMDRAGFKCLAALDFNPEALETYRTNFPNVAQVLEKDLTKFAPSELAEIIGTNHVDVIAGGPPCQGFSNARKVDGANHHGERFKDDPRRQLFRQYLTYVEYFQPRIFVMENVLGIQTAAGGAYFTAVQHEARLLGYRVVAQVADAFALGVPQKRRRQLIVGVRSDLPGFFQTDISPAPRALPETTLGAAIGDLPPLRAGEGKEECAYDMGRRRAHLASWGSTGRRYLYDVLEVSKAGLLTAHRARPHSARDLRDFALLREGESSAQAMRRGVVFEWPYSKDHFKDRYTRQSRLKACSTIVAHLSKDGLMFIHPTQNRSLTPREAARVQSFPDWFRFPVARTHQFRLIGNAVPPLVAEAVGREVKEFLTKAMNNHPQPEFELTPLPRNESEALEWLLPLLDLDHRALRKVPSEHFKRAWYSIAFLHAGLHPDSALDHGTKTSTDIEDYPLIRQADPRLLSPYFERSGWPVVLAPIAREAWRRSAAEKWKDEEFYCCDAQMAGMCFRNSWIAKVADQTQNAAA